jgi:hypothetical protein
LLEGTKFTTSISSIEFKPDGSAIIDGSGNIIVGANDNDPEHVITVNTATSKIRVDP